MANLKVTVPLLNKRKSPVLNTSDKSNVIGQVKKDFEFESLAAFSNAIGTWHKDSDGYYYWGGGIEEASKSSNLEILDYNNLSPLPQNIKELEGEGVTVGILDTGSYANEALSILTGYNFIDNNQNYNDVSKESHGTFVTGIIQANNIGNSKLKGVAPKCKILIAKIANYNHINNPNAVLEGLKWLIQEGAHIINCSFDFSPSNTLNEFEKLIADNSTKIIWVGAAQDNEGLFESSLYYPAKNKNFLSIGSINLEVLKNYSLSNLPNTLKYIMYEVDFISTDKYNSYDTHHGSSFASALLAGNTALIYSYLIQKNNGVVKATEVIEVLNRSIELPTIQSQNNFKIFKTINS
jgi:hypothetical protein